jgi:oxygen-independent coproporphyrinogen-3 oxidase
MLEREHGYPDVVQAVSWARQAGFSQISLDLIFGLPYQTLATWQQSTALALNLQPDHLSLYALSLEDGTPLENWVARGLVSQPDPDLAADMYEWAAARLEEEGFTQYEISNWARTAPSGTALICRHNLQYWRNAPYIGLGAGAHGFIGGYRTATVRTPANYIQRCLEGVLGEFPRTPATVSAVRIERRVEMQETMLMGLRLTHEGVSNQVFTHRFGESIQSAFSEEVQGLLRVGLLEWGGEGGDILRLTPQGRLVGNQVFIHFI